MNITQIIKRTLFILLITVCSISFAFFIFYTELLNIQKVSLKEGVFDVLNIENVFEISNLKNKTFDLVIKFFKESQVDYSKLFMEQIPYTISIELKDLNSGDIEKKMINQHSGKPGGLANDYFEWTLAQFKAEKKKKYKITVIFLSDFKYFDTMKKEIYVEQHYDHPSMPFWYLFQRVSLVLFIVSFIPLLIITFIYLRNRRKQRTIA